MISYEEYAKIRDEKGMRDADVARAAKIPPSTFTEWKKGGYTPKFDKMVKIADVFGMYYLELVDPSGQPIHSDNPETNSRFVEKPKLPEYDTETQEFIHLFQNVSDEDRDTVMKILRNLQPRS